MDHLTGPLSYIFIIDSGEKDGINEPEYLRTVERFYKEYQERFPKDVRHIASSLGDY